jgi:hypothetical protein
MVFWRSVVWIAKKPRDTIEAAMLDVERASLNLPPTRLAARPGLNEPIRSDSKYKSPTLRVWITRQPNIDEAVRSFVKRKAS